MDRVLELSQYIDILKKEFPYLQYVNGALLPDKIKVCVLGRYFSIGVFNMKCIEDVNSFYKYVDDNIYNVCYAKGEQFPNIYPFSEPLEGYPFSEPLKDYVSQYIRKIGLSFSEPLEGNKNTDNADAVLIAKKSEGYPHLGEAYTGILHRHPASDKWPEMKKHVVVDLEDWEYVRELIKRIEPLKSF